MQIFGMDLHTVPGEETLSSHRYELNPWSEDEQSTLLFDVSSDSDAFCHIGQSRVPRETIAQEIKTKDEFRLNDLPPTEELFIEIPKEDLRLIGRIHSIVQTLVVVHGEQNMMPIDIDSELFIAPDKPLGRVFDVFGTVVESFYCVRFDSVEQLKEKKLNIGDNVFFAPEKYDLISYVFVDKLQNGKGSDASWKYNNKLPEECLDFSDNEKEARYKTRNKLRREQFLHYDCDTLAKRSTVEYKPPSQQTQTPVFQPHQKVIQVQAPVQLPIVKPQQPFQMQIPFQPRKVPYLLAPTPFHTDNFVSRQQFQAQVTGIQQQLIQQQISFESSCLSMATMTSFGVGCKPPTQQIQTPVFRAPQFQFQVQRPVQLVQAPLIKPQQPFQMQIPFQHAYHFNSCLEAQIGQTGSIQPHQQPQVPYVQASTSFQAQVPRMQQQPVQHQTFSNPPGIEFFDF